MNVYGNKDRGITGLSLEAIGIDSDILNWSRYKRTYVNR